MDFKPLLVFPICFCLLFPKFLLTKILTNNYETEWKQVDELIKKEQPESSLINEHPFIRLQKKTNTMARLLKRM